MTIEQETTEERLRQLAAGRLNESELHDLEERLFADDELFSRAVAAEDDLIDDYARGVLSGDERAAVERRAADDARFWKRIQIARALSAKLAQDSNVVPFKRDRGERARRVRYFAAAAILTPLLATALFVSRRDDATVSKPDRAGDVARVDPSIRQRKVPTTAVAPRIVTATLALATLRGAERRTVVDLADGDVLHLTLSMDANEPGSDFQVRILDRQERQVWGGTAVRDGSQLTVDVPTAALSSGRHEIAVAQGSEDLAFLPVEFRK